MFFELEPAPKLRDALAQAVQKIGAIAEPEKEKRALSVQSCVESIFGALTEAIEYLPNKLLELFHYLT